MADKKLTKVQKQILETLRDTPGARLVSIWNGGYQLRVGDVKVRAIRYESFRFLKPWLEAVGYSDGDHLYAFKPGAEITDAWRDQEIERLRAELERQRAEKEQRQAESQRIIEQARVDAQGRLKEVLSAIRQGQIENFEPYGWNGIRFRYGGKWYNLSEEG